MLILMIILALFWVVALFDAYIGLRRIPRLETLASKPSNEKISVIMAAKNEENAIEKSITSLMKQTYPNLELIIVNDRSTDDTGLIANRYATYENVKVHHVETLPDDWLGKNHALYQGYTIATGDYLIFTDADIEYKPNMIEKTFSLLLQEKASHVTVAPDLEAKGMLLKGFIAYFLFGFGFFKRPWTANNDTSRKGGMGVGAFQLLSKEVYELVGTHKAMANRPDDDLYLGQQVKQNGHKQRLVTGLKHLKVEWYPTLRNAIKGLEKNTFAGLHYSWLFALFAITGTLISQVLPFLVFFVFEGITKWISLLVIVLIYALHSLTTKKLTTYSLPIVILFPLQALLFTFTISRAVLLTYYQGGITWRGTFYPLSSLKKQKHL
ncbi:glycosyltransferase [Pontibacillus yanchengensis]|uniref:4,4'-diaponeurosporenoate glycosyltransferase n=1 Tax=Pontibacillus yanchengensis Y32 TaxID=1385514 RepID=A0A0A2TCS3_9BACI|nr:glycosyltransferase family A protein [Pontibacillus yanchengensis]KGP73324.1 glycosyl transferase [Pontibacillus yanchengensis Y32]